MNSLITSTNISIQDSITSANISVQSVKINNIKNQLLVNRFFNTSLLPIEQNTPEKLALDNLLIGLYRAKLATKSKTKHKFIQDYLIIINELKKKVNENDFFRYYATLRKDIENGLMYHRKYLQIGKTNSYKAYLKYYQNKRTYNFIELKYILYRSINIVKNRFEDKKLFAKIKHQITNNCNNLSEFELVKKNIHQIFKFIPKKIFIQIFNTYKLVKIYNYLKSIEDYNHKVIRIQRAYRKHLNILQNKQENYYRLKELIYKGKLSRVKDKAEIYLKLPDKKIYDINFYIPCNDTEGSFKKPLIINSDNIQLELTHPHSYRFNQELDDFLKKHKINNVCIGFQISPNRYISKVAGEKNLYDILFESYYFNTQFNLQLFSQLLLTLKIFHQNHWFHRDLKLENIMVQIHTESKAATKLVFIDGDDITNVTNQNHDDIIKVVGTPGYTTINLLQYIIALINNKSIWRLSYCMQVQDEYAMALVMLLVLSNADMKFYKYIINEDNYAYYNGINYLIRHLKNDMKITKFINQYIKEEHRANFVSLIKSPLDYAKTQYKRSKENNKLLLERRVHLFDMFRFN
jgi:serine/threonine protein kinase